MGNKAISFRTHSLLWWTLLLLQAIQLVDSTTTNHVYYIKPSPDTLCPAEPCLTLSEYAEEAVHSLAANTTVIFLPGNHSLDQDMVIANVTRFAMLGQTNSPEITSSIICIHPSVFVFLDILDLEIRALRFSFCGTDADPAILVSSVPHSIISRSELVHSRNTSLSTMQSSLILNGTIFISSLGTGLELYGSKVTLHENTFSGNVMGGIFSDGSVLSIRGNVVFVNNSAVFGGAIHAINSSIDCRSNTTFIGNIAERYGGAVYITNSLLAFHEIASFVSNAALSQLSPYDRLGGAIRALNSSLSMTGSTSFVGNLAGCGGAIEAENSYMNFSGTINFTSNFADQNGGALKFSHSNINCDGMISLLSNTAGGIGGGINAAHSNVNWHGNTIITNNSAENGGGVSLQQSSLNHQGENMVFANNLALYSGGGLDSIHSIVKFSGSTECTNNSAKYDGGGMHALSCTLTLSGVSNFVNNSADVGGGMFVQMSNSTLSGNITFVNNSAKNLGGGMFTWTSNLIVRGDINFLNNSAVEMGGGLNIYDSTVYLINNLADHFIGEISTHSCILKLSKDSSVQQNSARYGRGLAIDGSMASWSFANNTAKSGGGVFSLDSVISGVNGISNFRNNSAELGGAMHLSGGEMTLSGSNTYLGNLAHDNGGGIYMEEGTLHLDGSNDIIDNTAAAAGGGIYVSYGSILNLSGDTAIVGNSALHGGGVSVHSSNLTCTGCTVFRVNIADIIGGGFGCFDSSAYFKGATGFVHNVAASVGGGIGAISSSISLSGRSTLVGNSATTGGGGVELQLDSSLTFVGSTTFINNSAIQGGGIRLLESTVHYSGNSTILNNSAYVGGGMLAYRSNVTMNENVSFMYNFAVRIGGSALANHSYFILDGSSYFINSSSGESGGGISVNNSILNIYGSVIFTGHYAPVGAGVDITWKSTLQIKGYCKFAYNSAGKFGGGINVIESRLIFSTVVMVFTNNSAVNGGGIQMQDSELLCKGHMEFLSNLATSGGGLRLMDSTMISKGSSSFTENVASFGGAILVVGMGMARIVGTSTFTRNQAQYGGGAVFIGVGSLFSFDGVSTFVQNSAVYGGGVHVLNATLRLLGDTLFNNNSATYGGGVHGSFCTLEIDNNTSFTGNSALMNGGGLSFASNSKCFLSSNTTVNFSHNHAGQYGGGIIISDNTFIYCTSNLSHMDEQFQEQCFFQPSVWPSDGSNVTIELVLQENTAGEAGSAVYGGMLDRCSPVVPPLNSSAVDQYVNMSDYAIIRIPTGKIDSGAVFDNLSTIIEANTTVSIISSDPFRVCLCDYGLPNCNTSNVSILAYPGETFDIELVAVGQREGRVPSVINSNIIGSRGTLGALQTTQLAMKTCTLLQYTIFTNNSKATLDMYTGGPCLERGIHLYVNVTLPSCPTGFMLSQETRGCVCEERLQRYTLNCSITDGKIERDGHFWIGLDEKSGGIILHPHCPFDYCKTYLVYFAMNETDLQCNYNRIGMLCGGCQSGLSLALGSSRCLHCSNAYLSLLAAFAVAGICLVLFLLLLKLTVAEGSINGLIFYANIVAMNQSTFFPSTDGNVLTVFIAWLNLDFGIETCFFDGMDAYTAAWLQFVFPLYVWLLVTLIVILSHYSGKVAMMFGRNPVAVLATLFLLSYAKILRTIITALSFTFLEYPDESEVAVWLYDGNIKYLQGKHIPLFLFALLMLLVLFLPYTLILSVGQFLQAKSSMRAFSWISDFRVKAFLDAYHGPFRDDHRYWQGLLLVIRSALFVIFACNWNGDPSVNLLAITSCTLGLTVLTRFTGSVYKSVHLDILESSFILNAGILAAATLYVRNGAGNQTILASTSVGVSLITFTGIVIYHAATQVKGSRLWRNSVAPRLHRRRPVPTENEDADTDSEIQTEAHQPPTTTFVDLRELLLEDSN